MEDMEQADCFLLAGTNTTEAHPVVGARIKQAVLRGARLVVVDPRRIELADFADVHLHGRPGSNVAVFNGLAHLLVEEGLVDEVFLKERADGWDELRSLLADYPPERVEELSGVPVDDLRRAALLYGRATRPAIVYGLGITEHMHGTDGVRTLANLAILTGHGDRRGVGGPRELAPRYAGDRSAGHPARRRERRRSRGHADARGEWCTRRRRRDARARGRPQRHAAIRRRRGPECRSVCRPRAVRPRGEECATLEWG